jgi:hypothetical protein
MTAAVILEEARAAGVALSATAKGMIRWRCRGPLPDSLRAMILTHKAELLEALGSKPVNDTERPIWVLLPNGMPVQVPSHSLAVVPTGALYWCREGDADWRPLPGAGT